MRTRTSLTALSVATLLTLTGCAGSTEATAPAGGPAAEDISVADAWVKAAEEGMTAAFGTLTNAGQQTRTVVAVESPASTALELHETVASETGEMIMQEVPGFTLGAGDALELAPGGDHIMLMDLTGPIHPGDEVTFTLVFDDESELAFTAPAKEFAGANENYDHGHHDH